MKNNNSFLNRKLHQTPRLNVFICYVVSLVFDLSFWPTAGLFLCLQKHWPCMSLINETNKKENDILCPSFWLWCLLPPPRVPSHSRLHFSLLSWMFQFATHNRRVNSHWCCTLFSAERKLVHQQSRALRPGSFGAARWGEIGVKRSQSECVTLRNLFLDRMLSYIT